MVGIVTMAFCSWAFGETMVGEKSQKDDDPNEGLFVPQGHGVLVSASWLGNR